MVLIINTTILENRRDNGDVDDDYYPRNKGRPVLIKLRF